MSDRLPIPIAGWRFTQAGPVTRAGWARGIILSSGTAQFVPTEKGVAYYNNGAADASPVVSGGESEVQITGPFTFAAWIYIDAYSSADGHTVMSIVGDPNGETEPDNFLTNITLRSDAVGQFHEYGGGTNEIVSAAVPGPSIGAWHHFVFVRDSANKIMEWWWDGELRASASYNNEPTGGQNAILCIGEPRRASNNAAFIGEAWNGYIVDPVVWDQALARAEIERLHLLHGELFRPARRFVPAQQAADTSLAANAQSTATATADLTTAIPLTGASVSVATAQGQLTTAIPLAGAAAAASIAGGELTVIITLEGAALAQALATGSLSTAIPLSGDAAATASATGDLGAGAALAGDALAQALATGTLTTRISLSGAALAQAMATGDLTAPGSGLSGSAQATASATGSLITEIPLAGSATATAAGSGGITTEIPLAGAAAGLSGATGTLDVAITLAADAAAEALAAGTLTTAIPLSGAALAQALATATITDSIGHRRAAQGRLGVVWPEARHATVPHEPRRAAA